MIKWRRNEKKERENQRKKEWHSNAGGNKERKRRYRAKQTNKQRKPVHPIKEMNGKNQSNSKRKWDKKSCH